MLSLLSCRQCWRKRINVDGGWCYHYEAADSSEENKSMIHSGWCYHYEAVDIAEENKSMRTVVDAIIMKL